MSSASRSRLVYYLLLLIVGVLLIRESSRPTGQRLHEQANAWLISASGKKLEHPGVLFIAHDEENASLTGVEELSAMDAALFLRACRVLAPKTAAVASSISLTEGQLLLEALLTGKDPFLSRILLGLTLDGETAVPPDALFPISHLQGSTARLREFEGMRRSVLSPAPTGYLNLQRADAPGNTAPLLGLLDNQPVASFALRVVAAYLDVTPGEIQATLGEKITFPEGLGIPLAEDGTFRLLENIRQSVEIRKLDQFLLDLSLAESKGEIQSLQESFDGKILILGRNDASAQTLELADGTPCSPAFYQAMAVASLISGFGEIHIPVWISLLWLAFACLCLGILGRLKPTAAILWTLGGICGIFLLAIAISTDAHMLIPVLLPATLMATACLLRLVEAYTAKSNS